MSDAQTSAPDAPLPHPVLVRLREALGADAVREETVGGQLAVRISANHVPSAMRVLRDDSTLRFSHLSDVTAVDYLEYDPNGKPGEGRTPRFDVVYHLYSIPLNQRVRVKVAVDEDGGRIASVTNLWPSANWAERETFDLFGIVFEGHPNLTRILTPEDWQGHPLRKDYPLIEEDIEFTTTLERLNEGPRSRGGGG